MRCQSGEVARESVIDVVGVALAGYTEPSGVGRLATEYVTALGGEPQATLIGSGRRTSVLHAAYANGTMSHALDFDPTWFPLNHPASPTIPGIMALAELRSATWAQLIAAVVVAFEVQGRLRLASTGQHPGKGFHKPGTTGLIGAAAGCASILGLSPGQTLNALGIAASRAGSLSINTGTMTKPSHAGHAARMGVESALLAELGWTANGDVFGPGGYFDTFLRGEAEPRLLVEGFGAPYRMVDPGVALKKYPCNYYTQRGIDAALAIRERITPGLTIEAVNIVFPEFDHVDRPRPKTGLDGKFSVQFTAALALLDGKVTVDSFMDDQVRRPDVQDMLGRTTMTLDSSIPVDFPDTWTEVSVRLSDGSVVTERMQKLTGFHTPLSDEQISGKFISCATRALGDAAAVTLLRSLQQITPTARVDTVTPLFGAPRIEEPAI